MNTRIRLSDISTQISTKVTNAKIGTAFDRDFLDSFGKNLPEVWVVGVDTNSYTPEAGLTGRFRQYMNADVAVRVMVARYPEGSVNIESAFGQLCDSVAEALVGWSLPISKEPFKWQSSSDGEISQSVIYADMIFRTLISYQR